MEEAAKTAKQSAESVSKGGERLGRTAQLKALSQVSWAALVPVGIPGSVLFPPPGAEFPSLGSASQHWVVLGKWPLGELRINRPELQPAVEWLTPLGLAQNPKTVASGHLRS